MQQLPRASRTTYIYVPVTSHLYSLDRVSNLAVAIVAFALDFLFLRKDPVQAGIVVLTYLGSLYTWGSFKEFREKSSILDLQIAKQEATVMELQSEGNRTQAKLRATELQIALLEQNLKELPEKVFFAREALKANDRMIEADVETCGYRVTGVQTEGPNGRMTFTKTKVSSLAAQSLPTPTAPSQVNGNIDARKIVPVLKSQSGGTGEDPL